MRLHQLTFYQRRGLSNKCCYWPAPRRAMQHSFSHGLECFLLFILISFAKLSFVARAADPHPSGELASPVGLVSTIPDWHGIVSCVDSIFCVAHTQISLVKLLLYKM